VRPVQVDAQIATALFEDYFGAQDACENNNRPILFSRMLRGEYSVQPEIADKPARRINTSISVYRGNHNFEGPVENPLTANDLYSPLHKFIRRFIDAVVPDRAALDKERQKFFLGELTRTQKELLDILAPTGPKGNPAKLLVLRMATDQFTGVPQPPPPGPVIFDPGSDMAQLSIEGLSQAPIAAYTFFARDPSPECWLWDLSWVDTVRWLPYPFKPDTRRRRPG
jgi:hypothetical protein